MRTSSPSSRLSLLTTKQRNALKAVYLNNPKELTRADIARRLGIREDSLQERVDGALKKLRKQLRLPPPIVQPKVKSVTATVRAVAPRIRKDVDVAKIKRAADEWQAARMAFETSWMKKRSSGRF